MSVLEYHFGSGVLFGKPVGGNIATDPTPQQFGALQDVTLEFSFDEKELHGQFQLPLMVARAKGKITGKAKYAQISGKQMNDLFWAQTLATGQHKIGYNESHVIPATPFQVTIAPPSSGVFVEDLGVLDGSTGLALVKHASPATGQYSVDEATGIYTFAAADTGKTVYVSYKYSVATGNNVVITNQLMGYAPVIEVHLFQTFNALQDVLKLTNCVATKLSRSTKLDDFTIPEFDFSAFADASGAVGRFDMAQ